MESQGPSHPLIVAKANQHYETAEILVKYGGNSALELQHALTELQAALHFTPQSTRIYNLLAEVNIRALDYSSTITCLRFVMKIDPDHQRCRHMLFELLVLNGLEIFRHGRYYARACYRFTEALKLESSRPKIWTFKAICHVQMREFKQALESTTRAIHTSSPPTADLYVMRAKLLWADGLLDQGSRDIQAARALDKTHPEVIAFTQRSFRESELLYASACRQFEKANFDACRQDVHMALMMTPEDIKLYLLESKALRMQGSLDEAYAILQKVKHMYEEKSAASGTEIVIPIEVCRQINLIFNEMAIKLSSKGKYERAIILFKKIIDSERKIHKNETNVDHRFFVNLGDCYRALEDGDKALGCYRTALKIEPTDFDVKIRMSMTHYLLGTKLFNDCRYDQAEKEMTLAIQFNPKVSEYFAVRGKARFYIGDYSEAHVDYLRALELNPGNSDIRDRLKQFGQGTLEEANNSNTESTGVSTHVNVQFNNSQSFVDKRTSNSAPALLQHLPQPIVPTHQDTIEMLLNAKHIRGNHELKNHQSRFIPSIRKISTVHSQPDLCRSLLPKLNPNLAHVTEVTGMVQESREAVTNILKDNVSLKRDVLWSMMSSAKGIAAANMKPKNFKKKNRKSNMPTSAAAMKRASMEHAREAQKTAVVAGVVTKKDDVFIKALSEPVSGYSTKKKSTISNRLGTIVDTEGKYTFCNE